MERDGYDHEILRTLVLEGVTLTAAQQGALLGPERVLAVGAEQPAGSTEDEEQLVGAAGLARYAAAADRPHNPQRKELTAAA